MLARTEGEALAIGVREVWRGKRGYLEFCRLRDDVVLVALRGHLDGEAASYLVARLPELLDRSGTTVFWDGGELISHGARVPAQIVPALARLRRNIDEFHVLVRSPLLTMTASAANLALGGELSVYRERERFDEAIIREAIQPAWSRARYDSRPTLDSMAVA
ncbi:hypothetical protein ACNOYE_03030 [Nannocystaceae bacterium ST9]